jgi:tricorn protease
VPVAFAAAALLVIAWSAPAPQAAVAAAPDTPEPVRGYYREPAIHGDTIVFTAEGDLWTVGIAGGVARRLTSHPGEETHAAISPDGRTLAFSAAYEGAKEVYTMPLAGGLPVRRTWDGDEDLLGVGFTPGGRVLYATRRLSTLPDWQLATVDLAAGERRVLPLSQAAEGAWDRADGTLFFTRPAFQTSHTKRYRGGTAQKIWALVPGAAEARALTADWDGTSRQPMWWDGRVYFVSDRDGTLNLWSMAPGGGDLRQHTRHQGWDVASPSLDDGRIVYKLGADLRLLDLRSGDDRALDITLASDLDQRRERWIADPLEWLTAAHLSPGGDRVVLTARGQVFVAPVKQGRFVEATREPGVRYRQARFLGDGRALGVLSDQSGEVELWTLPADGLGAPAQLTRDGRVLRFDVLPSPDGARIAFHDKDQELWIHDVAK